VFFPSCRRTDADEALKAAQESGNQEEIEKYSKRSIKVGGQDDLVNNALSHP
jgi:hypothetical protein